MVNRVEHFILYFLAKRKKNMTNPVALHELKTTVLVAFSEEHLPNLDQIINRTLFALAKDGYIVMEKKESEEYKKCIEKLKERQDRRITNPDKYCRKRYPVDMVVEVTDKGLVKYIHNVYCISMEEDKSKESARSNKKRVEAWLDLHTNDPVC